MYTSITLVYTWNYHNIVNKLHSNIDFKNNLILSKQQLLILGFSQVNNCQDGRGLRDIRTWPTEVDKTSLKMHAFRIDMSRSIAKATPNWPY